MHTFEDLNIVQSTLQRLMKREPPLAMVLPRQPGTKEARYAHLLSGEVELPAPEPDSAAAVTKVSADLERIAHLENQVADLRTEINELKEQLSTFRKQFE